MGCIRVGVLQAAIKEGRKMTQKDAEYEIAEAREIGESTTNQRSWAYRLKLRELLGEKLTAAQRAMWREAVKSASTP